MLLINFSKNYTNLKLPIYFDSMKSPLNRFESFIYNFEFNLDKRSYILYFYFGSKERLKVLFSSFFYFLSLKKHTYVFYIKNLIYLFWNSLSSNLVSTNTIIEKDYFYVNKFYVNNLYSDFYYYLNFYSSKFDRINFDNMFDIDLSISTGYFDNYTFRFFKIVDDFNPFSSFFLTSFENSKFCLSSSYFDWLYKSNMYDHFKMQFLLMFNKIDKSFNYFSYLDSFVNFQLEEYFLLNSLNKSLIFNKFFSTIISNISFSFDFISILWFLKINKNIFKFFIYFYLECNWLFKFFQNKSQSLKNNLSLIISNLYQYQFKLDKNILEKKKKVFFSRNVFYNKNYSYSLYFSKLLSLPSKVIFNIPKFRLSYLRLGESLKTYPVYSNSRYFLVKSLFKDQHPIKIKKILRKFTHFLKNFNMLIFSIYKKDFLQSFFSYRSFNFEIYIKNFIYSFKLFFINYKDILKYLVNIYIKKYKKIKKIKLKQLKYKNLVSENRSHFNLYKMPKELCI